MDQGEANTATLVDSVCGAQVNLVLAGSARDRRGGGGPGLPQGRDVRGVRGVQHADLYPSAGVQAVHLGAQARGGARRRPPTGGGCGESRSQRLQKQRSELVKRSFAHVCETGGGREIWLLDRWLAGSHCQPRSLAGRRRADCTQILAPDVSLFQRAVRATEKGNGTARSRSSGLRLLHGYARC